MIRKFKINVQMDDRWVPYFMSMLKRMEHDGNIGHSEKVTLFSDGCGDFRPKFYTNIDFELMDPIEQNSRSTTYDAG